jgi:hypothetical protein
VIGGFIQKENVGFGSQSPSQKRSTFLASGEGGECLAGVQAKERAELVDRVSAFGIIRKPRPDKILHRAGEATRNLLGKKCNPKTRGGHDGPLLRLEGSRQNLEKGRLTLPVSPHQTDSLPGMDLQAGPVQEGAVAEEDPEVLTADQGQDGLLSKEPPERFSSSPGARAWLGFSL